MAITCADQSTRTLYRSSALKPHCHWPNQRPRGGTRSKSSPLIGWDARCSRKHKEARPELSSWMGKPLKSGSAASVGSEVRQWTGVRVTSQVFSGSFARAASLRFASSSVFFRQRQPVHVFTLLSSCSLVDSKSQQRKWAGFFITVAILWFYRSWYKNALMRALIDPVDFL